MEKLNSPPSRIRPRLKSFMVPKVNPFVQDVKLSTAQKIQCFVMTVSVVPIRITLFAVTLLLTSFFGFIFTYKMPISSRTPASSFRVGLFSILRRMGRLCFFFLGFHDIQIRGKRASCAEAPLLAVAPHSSFWDVFVTFVSDPLPSSVSRSENMHLPILGNLSKAVQPIFVERSDPNSRQNTIQELVHRTSVPGKWPQIIIFPEGTCTNRKALITYKLGAFIPGAAVQPVLIEFLNDLDTFTWTMKGLGSFQALWFSLCQFSIKTRITYMPVYHPSTEEKADPRLFANNVRAIMADALGVPCTEHTFDDCRLMRKAASLNLPMETGLVEFAKVGRKLGMNMEIMQEKLEEFSKIACECADGLISLEDFAKFLNLPITAALREMFNLYDRNESGYIDFREYVIGLSLVSQPAVTEDTVKLAFKVFDKDRNGYVTEDELTQVLHSVFGDEMNASNIFRDIEKLSPDKVTYEEFAKFVKKRPEYAKMFVWFKEMMPDVLSSKRKDRNMLKEFTAVEKDHSKDD